MHIEMGSARRCSTAFDLLSKLQNVFHCKNEGAEMKLMRLFIMVFMMCAIGGAAFARSVVPIVNFEDQVVPSADGNLKTLDKVREAILAAGRDQEWQMNPVKDGHIVATRVIRGKHTMVLDIIYSPARYSVVYSDSINLNFKPVASVQPASVQGAAASGAAQGMIHPNYNKWVGDLNFAIARKLSQL